MLPLVATQNSTEIASSRYIAIFTLLFSLVMGLEAYSTHIVGGEIYYEQLDADTYEITLKVYRDCGPTNTNGTDFDQFASVGVYTNGSLYTELLMNLSGAWVNYVPVVLENPCFVLPPDVCVEEAVYTEIVNLPPNVNGYDLVYQRCCRNPSIININVPEDSGATFTTQIPGSNLTDTNSCPQFTNFPPVALCANASFWFDHSATDIDGDYLVYSFCAPMLGGTPDAPAPAPPSPPPFATVSWAAGFSATDPITADNLFTIDPETGLLEGTPTQSGQYVIGICVSEYRDGFLLSTTNRDFQFNVTVCDPNIIAAIPDQTTFCDGLTFEFTNDSFNAEEFYWDFGDPSTLDDWSTDAEPTWVYADTGTYQVTLIANPTWPCADTATAWYTAYPLVAPEISDPEFECVDGQQWFDIHAVGDYDDDAAFVWDFGPDIEPPLTYIWDPDPLYFGGEGSYDVSLTLWDNGCDSTVSITIDVPPQPVAGIADQDIFCDGFEFNFGNLSVDAEEYVWNFNDPWFGSDFSTEFEPTWTYSDTGLMTVQLIASSQFACPDTTWKTFEIYTLLAPWFENPGAQCFEGNSFAFEALGTDDDEAIYDWDFGENSSPSNSSFPNPTGISYSEPGTYEITLTISENDCEESFSDEVDVIPNPTFGFYLFNENGCPPHYASFVDSSYAETTLYYQWDFGDGSQSGASDPVHIYQYPGTYDVTVTISTASGCAEAETFFIPDAVTVHAPPQAGIDVEPNTVNILEPTVQVWDLSKGGVDCEYYVSDGGFIDECDSYYTFSDGGIFDIYQIITNIHGCRDTAHAQVAVEGFMFYAPNAFTPNNDGVNDVWLPSALGVKEYDLRIYNRWGEEIWSTMDRNRPWLGEVKGGEHYAQDGVYLYRVVIHDLLLLPHEFQGHITLIR